MILIAFVKSRDYPASDPAAGGGAKKHEIYVAAFGGHLSYELFVQGWGGGAWPPCHPLDPLLLPVAMTTQQTLQIM